MLFDPCIVTVRDFLTDKHGFTLPASRLSSYDETLKHASSSLFRNPRAFTVHFHASVHENDCDAPLEKEQWERGAYFTGKITLWAHFVRVSGVDIFGVSLEEREMQRLDIAKRQRRRRHECRTKMVHGLGKRPEAKNKVAPLEGFLSPPDTSHRTYKSGLAAVVPLREETVPEVTTQSKIARLSAGAQSTAVEDNCGAACTGQGSSLGRCDDRGRSESPLFVQDVMIKREISPINWDDDAVIEWDDEVCC